MKNEISVRQICFILIAYNAALKLLNFPSYMAYTCGNALLFATLFDILVQTAVVWSVAYLSSKTDKTFYRLLSDRLGEVTARVVFAFFALFFILNAVLPLSEQQLFVHGIFYDTVPSVIVFLPFFFFSVYAGAKGMKNAGRCADICLPIFGVTLVGLFAMSIAECRFSNLLPVLKQPFGEVAGASLGGISRFSESAFLLMYLGHFKYKKGDCTKITLSYALGGLIVLLFMAIFYAIYGELSQAQPFAIAQISIFFSAINLVGRVDLFALYALEIVMLFALVLNVQMCTYCLTKVLHRQYSGIFSFAASAALLILCILLNNRFVGLSMFSYKWLWIAAALFAYLIPVLCWTLIGGRKS